MTISQEGRKASDNRNKRKTEGKLLDENRLYKCSYEADKAFPAMFLNYVYGFSDSCIGRIDPRHRSDERDLWVKSDLGDIRWNSDDQRHGGDEELQQFQWSAVGVG